MVGFVEKKATIPTGPVIGYVIVRAGQLAAESGESSTFTPNISTRGFKVIQTISIPNSAGIELKLQVTGEEAIDTRVPYDDFLVCGRPIYTGQPGNTYPDNEAIEAAADALIADVLERIEVYRFVKPPPLEYRVCGLCNDGARVIFDETEKLWECHLHGFIEEELTDTAMRNPFTM